MVVFWNLTLLTHLRAPPRAPPPPGVGANFLSEQKSEVHLRNGDSYQVWSKVDEKCRRSSVLSEFKFWGC